MRTTAVEGVASELLRRALIDHGDSQAFVFGPDAEPFWCARQPLEPAELGLLESALDLIAELERRLPKPFVAGDPAGRFRVAALSDESELYVVLIDAGAEPAVEEDPRPSAATERLPRCIFS